MVSRIIKEAVIVALLGGAPLFVGYEFGGSEELELTIKSLIPNELTIYYSALLMVPYFLLAVIEWGFLKTTDTAKHTWRFIVSTLSEVGSGFLGILRAITGVLLCFPVLWWIYDANSFEYSRVSGFTFFGVVALAECVVIAKAHEWLKTLEPKRL